MAGNPLTAKLSQFADLSREETRTLEGWCLRQTKLAARKPVIREGDRPESVFIVLQGWACRYVVTRDGRRQMVGVLLPGDTTDLQASLLHRADHSIVTIGPATIASVRDETVANAIAEHPRLGHALMWSSLVDKAVARYWLLNIGQRDASRKMANLFCELWVRANVIGLVNAGQLACPLTQEDLSEALGLTSVHVNRTMMAMRETGLFEHKNKTLTVESFSALAKFADFDPGYLQLERRI